MTSIDCLVQSQTAISVMSTELLSVSADYKNLSQWLRCARADTVDQDQSAPEFDQGLHCLLGSKHTFHTPPYNSGGVLSFYGGIPVSGRLSVHLPIHPSVVHQSNCFLQMIT